MLSDQIFTDIIAEVRGGSFAAPPLWRGSPPVYSVQRPVPDDYRGDILALISQSDQKIQGSEDVTNVRVEHGGTRYRIQRCTGEDGAQIYFIRRPMDPVVPLSDFLFPARLGQELRIRGKGSGMVLAAGKMRSGKTTFLSSYLIDLVSANGATAITIEDPPETRLSGDYPNFGRIYQWELGREPMAELMAQVLRTGASYLMIGEIRTPAAALAASIAALNGMFVLASIHANSVSHAIVRMVNMAISADGEWARSAIAEGLSAVLELSMTEVGASRRVCVSGLLTSDDGCAVRSLIRKDKPELLKVEAQRQNDAMAMSVA